MYWGSTKPVTSFTQEEHLKAHCQYSSSPSSINNNGFISFCNSQCSHWLCFTCPVISAGQIPFFFFLFPTLGTIELKLFSVCCLSIDNACWKYALGYRSSGIKLDRSGFPFMMRSEQIPEQIVTALFPENVTAELCSCYYHKGFHQYFHYNLYFQRFLTQPEQFTMGCHFMVFTPWRNLFHHKL